MFLFDVSSFCDFDKWLRTLKNEGQTYLFHFQNRAEEMPRHHSTFIS